VTKYAARLVDFSKYSITAVALLLALATVTNCEGGEDEVAPKPSGPREESRLEAAVVEGSVTYSEEPFGPLEMTVRITNWDAGTYVWPDPCPIYHFEWSESVTTYGEGYRYLDCAGGQNLEPEESADFNIHIPAPEPGGIRLEWALVDPKGCDRILLPVDDDGPGCLES